MPMKAYRTVTHRLERGIYTHIFSYFIMGVELHGFEYVELSAAFMDHHGCLVRFVYPF